MSRTPKGALDRINEVTQAWANLRPAKSFSGLTLDQFKESVKPSHDIRTQILDLEGRLAAAVAQRAVLDAASLKTVKRIVDAVKSDPEEGDDGELYETMGFVRKSLRSTGLTRRKAKEVTSATAPESR